jgi:hypothetical protein
MCTFLIGTCVIQIYFNSITNHIFEWHLKANRRFLERPSANFPTISTDFQCMNFFSASSYDEKMAIVVVPPRIVGSDGSMTLCGQSSGQPERFPCPSLNLRSIQQRTSFYPLPPALNVLGCLSSWSQMIAHGCHDNGDLDTGRS